MSRAEQARAFIFDVDGTLVDTNGAHLEAWWRAFRREGYDASRERIAPQIGKGGDKLVPAILGREESERRGDAVREAHGEAFLEIAARQRFRVFPGAVGLLETLRDRGIRTALATSSDDRYVDATMSSAGVDFRELVDAATTKDDAGASKPAPDVVLGAVQRLAVPAPECMMLGDTRYDADACRRAGVTFVGVTCGGTDATTLLVAGARSVWSDPADVLAHLDAVLRDGARTA